MKLYISGPMSGKPDGNEATFDQAAWDVSEMGHEVVSPVDLHRAEGAAWTDEGGQGAEYERRLSRDLAQMDDCDGIVLLPGWQYSRGAVTEANKAIAKGMKLYEYWDHGGDPLEERSADQIERWQRVRS